MTNPSNKEASLEPLESKHFRFDCHPEVPCFTECCADLNLALTPYDILRLKKRLQLDASQFIDQYAEPAIEQMHRLPRLRLRMNDGGRKPCPFVTEKGCSVYDDRPSACRIYPLGRATAKSKSGASAVIERFFLVKEEHCKGFEESREWTVEDWTSDQGLDSYQKFNDLWMEIVTHQGSIGAGDVATRNAQMFFMASYNLEAFRRFVFNTSFLQSFEVDDDTVRRIRQDDEELLEFAIKWVRFALFGEPTMSIRKEVLAGRERPTRSP
ncbi:MAG: YkgJ family cysteine cluster protein [Deltaproteobacteria bacterium]|nr:YkgJ family cysteine cluster protein [Deltaproteobacteria bacterium]